MTKNYVEVVVDIVDEDVREGEGEGRTTYWKDRSVFYAVRPNGDAHKTWKAGDPEPEEWKNYTSPAWRLDGGQPVHIYDKETLNAYRKLLDAIEAELDSE